MVATVNSTGTSTGVVITPDSSGVLALQTAGTTAITVDTSQRVGIGETSPATNLDVKGTNAVARFNSSDANGVYAVFSVSGTAKGYIGSAYQIVASSSSNDFAVQSTNNFVFATGGSTERMRIDSSGNVLVGATAQLAGEKFHVSAGGSTINTAYFNFTTTDDRGNIICKHARATGATTGQQISFLNSSGTNVGAVNSTTSATSYATSSDYRLKENVQPMVGALDKVAQLKPVTYTWKIDGKDGQGFIAHELQAIVPDCVTGEKDAVDADGNPVYQGIDTSFLVATLTAALQETKALITAQAETINALTARIVALEGK